MSTNRDMQKITRPRQLRLLFTGLLCLTFFIGFGAYVLMYTQPLSELVPEYPLQPTPDGEPDR